MRKGFEFLQENEDGEVVKYDIEYTISKYYPGDYYNPPEEPEIEITSIKQDGKQVDVDEDTFLKMFSQIECYEQNEDFLDYDDYE